MSADASDLSYSPSSVLNLLNNSLVLQETKRLIQMCGIYQPGQGTNYQGMYYDKVKDEASDASLTLIVPGLIRSRLQQNKTISFSGYITKRVVANGGRIELQMNLVDLIEQTHNKYSDEEIKALEVLQKKAAIGYRDVQAFIKSKVIAGERTRIAVIIGRSAIIDQDVNHQLAEAANAYGINQVGCIYTAQGFEFDYVSVIFGKDLVYRFDKGWEGHPEESKDTVVKRSKGQFIDLVKNTIVYFFPEE